MESEKTEKSSILKPRKPRNPLSDVDLNESPAENVILNETQAIKRHSTRRVSFANSNRITEFATDCERNTIWVSAYEETLSGTQSSEESNQATHVETSVRRVSESITRRTSYGEYSGGEMDIDLSIEDRVKTSCKAGGLSDNIDDVSMEFTEVIKDFPQPSNINANMRKSDLQVPDNDLQSRYSSMEITEVVPDAALLNNIDCKTTNVCNETANNLRSSNIQSNLNDVSMEFTITNPSQLCNIDADTNNVSMEFTKLVKTPQLITGNNNKKRYLTTKDVVPKVIDADAGVKFNLKRAINADCNTDNVNIEISEIDNTFKLNVNMSLSSSISCANKKLTNAISAGKPNDSLNASIKNINDCNNYCQTAIMEMTDIIGSVIKTNVTFSKQSLAANSTANEGDHSKNKTYTLDKNIETTGKKSKTNECYFSFTENLDTCDEHNLLAAERPPSFYEDDSFHNQQKSQIDDTQHLINYNLDGSVKQCSNSFLENASTLTKNIVTEMFPDVTLLSDDESSTDPSFLLFMKEVESIKDCVNDFRIQNEKTKKAYEEYVKYSEEEAELMKRPFTSTRFEKLKETLANLKHGCQADDESGENVEITPPPIEEEKIPTLKEKIEEKQNCCKNSWKVLWEDKYRCRIETLHRTVIFLVRLKDNVKGIVEKLTFSPNIKPCSSSVALLVFSMFEKKFTDDHIKNAIGVQYDIQTLLDYIYMSMEEATETVELFRTLRLRFLIEMDKNFRVTYKKVNTLLCSVWMISIDLSNLNNVSENAITVRAERGEVDEMAIRKLASHCPKGLLFLQAFLEKVVAYVKELIQDRRKHFLANIST